jgi:hypothetical protein
MRLNSTSGSAGSLGPPAKGTAPSGAAEALRQETPRPADRADASANAGCGMRQRIRNAVLLQCPDHEALQGAGVREDDERKNSFVRQNKGFVGDPGQRFAAQPYTLARRRHVGMARTTGKCCIRSMARSPASTSSMRLCMSILSPAGWRSFDEAVAFPIQGDLHE